MEQQQEEESFPLMCTRNRSSTAETQPQPRLLDATVRPGFAAYASRALQTTANGRIIDQQLLHPLSNFQTIPTNEHLQWEYLCKLQRNLETTRATPSLAQRTRPKDLLFLEKLLDDAKYYFQQSDSVNQKFLQGFFVQLREKWSNICRNDETQSTTRQMDDDPSSWEHLSTDNGHGRANMWAISHDVNSETPPPLNTEVLLRAVQLYTSSDDDDDDSMYAMEDDDNHPLSVANARPRVATAAASSLVAASIGRPQLIIQVLGAQISQEYPRCNHFVFGFKLWHPPINRWFCANTESDQSQLLSLVERHCHAAPREWYDTDVVNQILSEIDALAVKTCFWDVPSRDISPRKETWETTVFRDITRDRPRVRSKIRTLVNTRRNWIPPPDFS